MCRRILIISTPGDSHTGSVCWGLRRLGHQPLVWLWPEFPRNIVSSIEQNQLGEFETVGEFESERLTPPYEVIWNRRRGMPTPSQTCHPADSQFVRSESIAYLRNAIHFLGNDKTCWINHPTAARNAENKVIQLQAAKESGFSVPDTLVTNDPLKVRNFFAKQDGKVIYKAFLPAAWVRSASADSEQISTLSTVAISSDHLENVASIRACAGIYQRRIDIDYELRVTVFGEVAEAVAINSQLLGPKVDWRSDVWTKRIPIERVCLTAEIRGKCVSLCRKLGLFFGCIDIIVNTEGEYIFLEINEAGQFLWKEQLLPDFPILDRFCRTIAMETDGKASSDVNDETIHLEEYMRSEENTAAELNDHQYRSELKSRQAMPGVYSE